MFSCSPILQNRQSNPVARDEVLVYHNHTFLLRNGTTVEGKCVT